MNRVYWHHPRGPWAPDEWAKYEAALAAYHKHFERQQEAAMVAAQSLQKK